MIKELNSILPVSTSYKPPTLALDIYKNTFCFSVEAVKITGLKDGDKITFSYDTEDPGIMYFYKCPVGFKLRKIKTSSGALRLKAVNSPAMSEIVEFLGLQKNTSFKIKSITTTFNGRQAWFITKY